MEVSKAEVNFLDTVVFRTQQNTLALKPYIKPMDKNTYLHFGSYPEDICISISHTSSFCTLKGIQQGKMNLNGIVWGCNSSLDREATWMELSQMLQQVPLLETKIHCLIKCRWKSHRSYLGLWIFHQDQMIYKLYKFLNAIGML